MTDNRDICERLEDQSLDGAIFLRLNAAKEIRALRHYVARLEEDLAIADNETERLRKYSSKQALDIVMLGQEVGRLREALQPFAKAAELFGERNGHLDMLIYAPAAGKEYQIVGDDLRRARAALAGKDEKP